MSAPRLYLVRDDLPPVRCAPWCEAGDGHPREFHPDDQMCRSAEVSLRAPGNREVVVAARQLPGQPPRICLDATVVGELREVDVRLTVAEARRFAEQILATCDLIGDTQRRSSA